ncbi:hypothetical protein NM208_g13695 [Fusarium decemcellulare]|uniref:Uncharacterized protein n=1 Tax=Fusarium decemcellulare TaxID=57161 RepID=A0ACC1RKN7_9HYPO|nr:hypothetical protein NM208_g13695 [Fusarium decemcellulare]
MFSEMQHTIRKAEATDDTNAFVLATRPRLSLRRQRWSKPMVSHIVPHEKMPQIIDPQTSYEFKRNNIINTQNITRGIGRRSRELSTVPARLHAAHLDTMRPDLNICAADEFNTFWVNSTKTATNHTSQDRGGLMRNLWPVRTFARRVLAT